MSAEYGYRSPGSTLVVTSDSYDDTHETARHHAEQGHDVELVRVEVIGVMRRGVAYAPASRTCYLCWKDIESRSPGCPGRTHK